MDTGQIVIEDMILASCDLWLGSAVNPAKVVKMLNEALNPDEAKYALKKLKADGVVEVVQKHNHGEKYFDDIAKVCATLISDAKMPKIVVASLDVFRIPRPESVDLDNVVVGARMDVMEKKMEGMDKNVTELLRNFKSMIENQMTQKSAAPLAPTVTVAHVDAGAGTSQAYAQAAAAGAARENHGVNRQRQFRPRLGSKRSFEEMNANQNDNTANVSDTAGQQSDQADWNDAPKRKPRKVSYGKAKVTSGRSDEAVAPFEIFIANTHPESTSDLIKEILQECSAADTTRSAALEIIDVKCMTNKVKIPDPRTLCWKVTVPHREREHMLKDESYPEGWAHRRFFPPRSNVPLLKPNLPAAKSPRMDVNNVDNVGA